VQSPVQDKLPHQIKFSQEEEIVINNEIETLVINNEIETLLNKCVIERVDKATDDYVSNIFTQRKRDGTYRVIFNLQHLNNDIEYHHFKMETIKSALCEAELLVCIS
jgi:hypothetical protein